MGKWKEDVERHVSDNDRTGAKQRQYCEVPVESAVYILINSLIRFGESMLLYET
jgi:hypothetical protein